MKEIQKAAQKLSREKNLWLAMETAAPVVAYKPVQKHKVTPGIPAVTLLV